MESGRVDVEQQRKQYHFEIKGAKVFATCSEIHRLSKPLHSRLQKALSTKVHRGEIHGCVGEGTS
jgi:hypothetical protein